MGDVMKSSPTPQHNWEANCGQTRTGRHRDVSGAADSGESRDGGTRAVSFSGPRHNESRGSVRNVDVPLEGRPHRERGISRSGQARYVEDFDEACSPAHFRGRTGKPAVEKRE